MKTIEMIHPIEQCYDHEPCALAIGFFDGIHTDIRRSLKP